MTGIREIAAAVREATQVRGKTVYTFSDERIASAAYWIGSQADEIYVTPSSTVGSIGTYLAWLDPSMKMAMEGLRLEYFGAGTHKGMGLPGKPLTEADRKLLQGKVEEINGWFKDGVSAARPKVADSTMQGQTFSGEEAVKLKLADGLVGSWEEFIELL
ncbi:S49 family peptidase [Verrucomicrobium spinosum]|uniref:S49 family peptidase n=1 Tax=Verrucomicrobium spinosum TaxID=2736 RepID=UPI000AB55FE1|nr:S49 family peptidase [Verrucomicrobium spinosum]